jgi:hypothetical protein
MKRQIHFSGAVCLLSLASVIIVHVNAQTTVPSPASSWYFPNESSFIETFDGTFLEGAGVAINLTFTHCNEHGLLVYAQGTSNDEYFGVGVSDNVVLVQFRQDLRTTEIVSTSLLEKGKEYTVSIVGLSLGGSSLGIYINGKADHGTPSSNHVFNFTRVTDVFIGGARDISQIKIPRLRSPLDLCITSVETASGVIDLAASTLNSVVHGCPSDHCQTLVPESVVSLTSNASYLAFDIITSPASQSTKLSIKFQTKYSINTSCMPFITSKLCCCVGIPLDFCFMLASQMVNI